MNDHERYLFDLMGYLVVDDVLTAAELRELNDLVDPGDGGFAAVPGSHKSNLPCPDDIKTFERVGPWLQQVPQAAGSAIIFTEALTHGTWSWRADKERRSLLYKFSPGHMSWARTYPSAADVPDAAWTEPQRRILLPPYVQQREGVVD